MNATSRFYFKCIFDFVVGFINTNSFGWRVGKRVELVTSRRKAFTPQTRFIVIITAACMHLWENPVNYY